MAFANAPNYSPFLTNPPPPFMPEGPDLGTALRAIQTSQQFNADQEQRKVANQQAATNAAESARSNRASEGYNRGTLDLQRSIFERKSALDKQESELQKKKTVEALFAELNDAMRSKNSVRIAEVKQKLQRFGLTVNEIEAKAAPAQPFSGDPIPPGTKVDDLDAPFSGDPIPKGTDVLDLDAPQHTTALPGGVIQNAPAPPKVDINLDEEEGLSPREQGAIGSLPPSDPAVLTPEFGGQPPPPVQSAPSGGFEVRDESGRVIHSTTEGQFGESVRLVESGLKPIIDGAPDYGKDAATEAARYGAVLAESGLSPDEAMDKAVSLYKWRLGEIEKTQRTDLASSRYKGGGGAAGPGMQSIRLATQQVNQHTNAVARDYEINGINEALNDLTKAEQAITSAEGGVGEIAAVTNVLKSLQGRISNYDMEQFIGAGGLMSQLTSLAGRTFGRGELDPTYLQQVRVLIQQTRQVLQAKKQEAARVLQQRIDTDYAIDRVPELKQQYKGWGEIVTGGQGGGGGSGGGMSDEDLLNAAD